MLINKNLKKIEEADVQRSWPLQSELEDLQMKREFQQELVLQGSICWILAVWSSKI